jgi:hypothetical protein
MSKNKSSYEKYLTEAQLDELVILTKEFYRLRNSAYEKFDIDLLDSGDSLSSANLYSIVKQYDHNFLPNFHRNGADGKSSKGAVEIKNTRVDSEFTKKGLLKKNPHNATWTLHAISDYSDRYIFVARSKITLEPVRIYDISDSVTVAKVIAHLEDQRQVWLAKSSGDIKKMKNDRIGISEKFIKVLGGFTLLNIDSCQVYIK